MADSQLSVLVTGAAGFIGSHVAEQLVRDGHDVLALDDLSGGFAENVPTGARFAHGSVTNADWMRELFDQEHFDYVFHFAAYAAEGLSHFIRRYNYTNNVIGSVNLINESVRHNVKRFVFASSIAVYGHAKPPMLENMRPEPADPYGIAKYAVELDLVAAHELFGLEFTIFRPHNVYGERQNTGDRYRNVIGIFINQLMRDEPMTIFGDGQQTRAFTYIDDVAPIIARSIENPTSRGMVFNIGADQPYTVLHLAHVVAQSFGKLPRIEHLPPRVEVEHAWSSHDLLRSVFSVPDPTPLEVGVGRMIEWAKTVGPRETPQFTGIELESDRFPAGWE